MKTIIRTSTSLLLVTITLFFACKKKESTPDNVSTTAGVTPHVNTITAKVNNVDWSLANNQGTYATFISKFGNSYTFGGQNSFNTPYTSIQTSFPYTAAGTYTFSQFGSFVAKYKDAAGTYYTAKTGTINITTLDTLAANAGIINKLKATFSFKTDTISNQSYTVTNGVIDYKTVTLAHLKFTL